MSVLAALVITFAAVGMFTLTTISVVGTLIEGRPILLLYWAAIALGAALSLLPLDMRSLRYRGAEMALRMFEADPSKGVSLIEFGKYSWEKRAQAVLNGERLVMTSYQAWRANLARRLHEEGVKAKMEEAAIVKFAQSIVDRGGAA